ncbi:hypothetical protein N7457_005629 [Penicillium paradoxum]|uniref:uncharacterized protein n=1 Tax=Penicillium paradoxum TaxID=176176 RepID=UPI0025474CC7|nr:uncharacterized protein N7457_005629 [Penicillium paradoxum]KAJ5780469.1 hypothetical protein N7457_005629 [Penicillium paradoxum]
MLTHHRGATLELAESDIAAAVNCHKLSTLSPANWSLGALIYEVYEVLELVKPPTNRMRGSRDA